MDRNRAIRAWHAADVPIEIFLRVIECYTEFRLSDQQRLDDAVGAGDWVGAYLLRSRTRSSNLVGLGTLASVCRAWYTLSVPLLYSGIKVTRWDIEWFRAEVRANIARYCRAADVRGPHHFLHSAHAARLLPGVVWLEWRGVWDPILRAPYHPSHVRVLSQVHTSFANVIHFDLQHCHFLSPTDLLRLLASLQSLVHVSLFSVTFSKIPHQTHVARPKASRIRRISVRYHSTVPQITALLAHTFTWPRPPTTSRSDGFTGLPWPEILIIRQIYQLLVPDDTTDNTILLDPTDDEKTCMRIPTNLAP